MVLSHGMTGLHQRTTFSTQTLLHSNWKEFFAFVNSPPDVQRMSLPWSPARSRYTHTSTPLEHFTVYDTRIWWHMLMPVSNILKRNKKWWYDRMILFKHSSSTVPNTTHLWQWSTDFISMLGAHGILDAGLLLFLVGILETTSICPSHLQHALGPTHTSSKKWFPSP